MKKRHAESDTIQKRWTPDSASIGIGKGGYHANELCFKCYYATGGCEWSDHFQPVPGWTVEKGKFEGWVHIIDCPKFDEGDKIWTKLKASNRNAKESLST